MERIMKMLELALEELWSAEEIYPDEVHEAEIECHMFGQYQQWAIYFPEYQYWCFSIAGNDAFIGYRETAVA